MIGGGLCGSKGGVSVDDVVNVIMLVIYIKVRGCVWGWFLDFFDDFVFNVDDDYVIGSYIVVMYFGGFDYD